MPRKSFALILLISVSVGLHGQDVLVRGNIISGDYLPVEAAEIKAINSGSTATSDKFGSFEISVPVNTTIIISKVGFSSHQRTITRETLTLTVRLESSAVSIGVEELTSGFTTVAIVPVQQKNFNQGIISSPELLIQGRVPGVRVTSGSGEPGSNIYTFIRGVTSLQGTEPLFVIDGFPIWNEDPYATSTDFGRGTSHHRDPLNFINPFDVERIDILKDESASALYGTRGGNGIVMIKTKNGDGAKHQLQFNTQLSLSRQHKYYDLLNRDQFLAGLAARGGDPVAADFGASTDWQKEISRSPLSQKYDLAYSNQYKSGSYRVTFGYDDQQGAIQESGMDRLVGTVHWNQSLKDNKWRIAANLSFSRLDDQYAFITTNAGFQGDLLGATYTANPSWPGVPDFQLFSYASNPLSLLKYHMDRSITNATVFNLSAHYTINKFFTASAKVGRNKAHSEREAAVSPNLVMGNGVDGNGRASIKRLDKGSDLFEATLNYAQSFENSRLSAKVGYAFQVFMNTGSNIEGWGFNNPNMATMIDDLHQSAKIIQNSLSLPYLQYGYDPNTFFIAVTNPTLEIMDMSSNRPAIPAKSVKEDLFGVNEELRSFFLTMNYSIRSKIFFNGSLRVDGSSLFGSNNAYGLFPAISASWRLSEEAFLPDFFSDLKLRAGFGKSGNQDIPYEAHRSRQQFSIPPITANGEIPIPGLITVGSNNPDLKWEEITGINFGIDFGFIENRFRGSLDVYQKTTSDFLFYLPIAQPSTAESALVNSDGKIVNAGVELGFDFTVIKKNVVDASFFANAAYNKNTLRNFASPLNFGNVYGQGITGATVQRIQNNEPLYSFYLREFKGYDTNGLSTYAGGEKIVGDPIPDLIFSFGGALQIKNWDFAILFSGLAGYSVYNNTANAFFTSGSLASARNVTADVLTSQESPQNAPEVSTRFLDDADFLKLQNVMIGRNFHFTKRPFKMIRAFLAGQNIVTWTNYSGLSPDTNTGSMGIDYSTYPSARTMTIGLQAIF